MFGSLEMVYSNFHVSWNCSIEFVMLSNLSVGFSSFYALATSTVQSKNQYRLILSWESMKKQWYSFGAPSQKWVWRVWHFVL
jgi:hypothetical protein